MDIDFLSVEEVLRIHEHQILRWGGGLGVRESGLLESAVNAPKATVDGAFLNQDLQEMAAAYMHSIVLNHPFVDGNKRTGATAAIVFLRINGVAVTADEAKFTELVLGVAQGQVSKDEIAKFLRANTASL